MMFKQKMREMKMNFSIFRMGQIFRRFMNRLTGFTYDLELRNQRRVKYALQFRHIFSTRYQYQEAQKVVHIFLIEANA